MKGTDRVLCEGEQLKEFGANISIAAAAAAGAMDETIYNLHVFEKY